VVLSSTDHTKRTMVRRHVALFNGELSVRDVVGPILV
jgi:hypothetical protein